MSTKTIIDMIEAVDPTDSKTLAEINARVWCFKNDLDFNSASIDRGYIKCGSMQGRLPNYTESRDTIKSLRPDNFRGQITLFDTGKASFKGWSGTPEREINVVLAETEELAELMAVVIAISYERS